MTIGKQQAKALLIGLFDDNSMTFKSMSVLKSVFDSAVADCNEAREEAFSDYHIGRGPRPRLPSQSVEEDFYYSVEVDAEQHLKKNGLMASKVAVEAVAAFAIAFAEIPPEDFYLKET